MGKPHCHTAIILYHMIEYDVLRAVAKVITNEDIAVLVNFMSTIKSDLVTYSDHQNVYA